MRQAAIRNPFISNANRGGGSTLSGDTDQLLAGHSPAMKVAGVRVPGVRLGKRTSSAVNSKSESSMTTKKSRFVDQNTDQNSARQTTPTTPSPPTFTRTPVVLSTLSNNSSGVMSIISTHPSSSPHPGKENVNPKAVPHPLSSESSLNSEQPEKLTSDGSTIDLTVEQLEILTQKDYSVSVVLSREEAVF
jgi:hypothetical protein